MYVIYVINADKMHIQLSVQLNYISFNSKVLLETKEWRDNIVIIRNISWQTENIRKYYSHLSLTNNNIQLGSIEKTLLKWAKQNYFAGIRKNSVAIKRKVLEMKDTKSMWVVVRTRVAEKVEIRNKI